MYLINDSKRDNLLSADHSTATAMHTSCSRVQYGPNTALQGSQVPTASPKLFWEAPPTHSITVSKATNGFHNEQD